MKEKEMKEERKEIGRKGEMGGEDRGRGRRKRGEASEVSMHLFLVKPQL